MPFSSSFTSRRVLYKRPSLLLSNLPPLFYAHTWTREKVIMASAASNSTPNAFTSPVNKTAHAFDKSVLDATLSRRFFFAPAFEIYGGEFYPYQSRRPDHQLIVFSPRCGRLVRLWTDGLSTTSEHYRCVEEALHHRRGHAGIRYHHHDAVGCVKNLGACRQVS